MEKDRTNLHLPGLFFNRIVYEIYFISGKKEMTSGGGPIVQAVFPRRTFFFSPEETHEKEPKQISNPDQCKARHAE